MKDLLRALLAGWGAKKSWFWLLWNHYRVYYFILDIRKIYVKQRLS